MMFKRDERNMRLAGRLTSTAHWFRFWMPYKFEKLESTKHRHLYLPLNRNYKPLGYTSRQTVEYHQYAHQAVIFKNDPRAIWEVWFDPEHLYLYDDGFASRRDYFARYEKLMSRSVLMHGMGWSGIE